jgi:hypothetical protein
MEAKRLFSIVKLRRMAVESAKEELALCVAAETGAATLCHSYESEIWRETEAAGTLSVTDLGMKAFAKWLPTARRKLAAARAQHEQATAETSRGRADLAVARGSLSAIEELWISAVNAELTIASQRSQEALEEIIRSRHCWPNRK